MPPGLGAVAGWQEKLCDLSSVGRGPSCRLCPLEDPVYPIKKSKIFSSDEICIHSDRRLWLLFIDAADFS